MSSGQVVEASSRAMRARAVDPAVGVRTHPRRPRASRRFPALLWSTYLFVLAVVHVFGIDYYLSPIGERVRSPLHDWLKPSGYIGQAAGIATFVLFLFMWLYPLRKRLPFLGRLGTMAGWLDVHIAVGLMLPLIGAVHAAWRFQGVIGLGYLAMVTVCLSGVVGRYVYTHIPRGRSGLELTRDEIHARRRRLAEDIARATGDTVGDVTRQLEQSTHARRADGMGHAVLALLGGDIDRWRATRRLRHRWLASGRPGIDRKALREITRLARREIALGQQLKVLDATRGVFRFWHVAHLPFAITAFLAVAIHVAVVIALGVTWLR